MLPLRAQRPITTHTSHTTSKGLIICTLLLLCTTASAQTTWYLNPNVSTNGLGTSPESPFKYIQDAIDASTNGDQLLLADGTYTGSKNRNLDFLGKAIAVSSISDNPDLCIIDCQSNGFGIIFQNNEGPDTTVQGITITRGKCQSSPAGGPDYAGGITCLHSSPTIANCKIIDNSVLPWGVATAAYCYQSDVVFTNCEISRNKGGINSTAALQFFQGAPHLINCLISGNVTKGYGGGINSDESDLAITNCTISDNTAPSGAGGGISARHGSLNITNSVLQRNHAMGGGAISLAETATTMVNCMISHNTASHLGGGVYCGRGPLSITNCTFTGNTATNVGGALHIYTCSPIITNTIFWDNAPEGFGNFNGTQTVTYSDVQGGYPGTGNIDADPLFVHPEFPILTQNSPCIDTGTNTPTNGLPNSDILGTPRPTDGDADSIPIADIGAHEFYQQTMDLLATPRAIDFSVDLESNNPPHQYITLLRTSTAPISWYVSQKPDWLIVSPELAVLTDEWQYVDLSVDISNLAPGNYQGTLTIDSPADDDMAVDISICLRVTTDLLYVPLHYPTIQAAIDAAKPGDTITVADGTYTGPGNIALDFHGKAITLRSDSNDPALCIIDCQGTTYGVRFRNGEGPTSVIDGFTITNGYAGAGSAINCHGTSPTIKNCVISNNTAIQNGGGIYCYDGAPNLLNCTIAGNSGAGLSCYDSNPCLTNCLITGNSIVAGGGAIRSLGNSIPNLTNCTVVHNFSGDDGAGIYCASYTSPIITNCIIWGNRPDAPSEHEQISALSPTINFSRIQNWSGAYGGIGNSGDDPQFLDPDGPDNDPSTWQDNDYRLAPASSCIDAGSNGALPYDDFDMDADGLTDELFPIDLDGLPRLMDDPATTDTGQPLLPLYPNVVDIGVYEFDPLGQPIVSSPAIVSFDTTLANADQVHQSLGIRTTLPSQLPWQITQRPDWLVVNPAWGTMTNDWSYLDLSLDTEGIDVGDHTGTLTISSTIHVPASIDIAVSLHVSPNHLNVPTQYQTIQDAIDAAYPGDTIEVNDGIYTGPGNINLDLQGKAITLRSASGQPALCIIDCQQSTTGIVVTNGEGPSTVIDGFTITNGHGLKVGTGYGKNVTDGKGGAIRCENSSPTINNCILINNTAATLGGGVYCRNGQPVISNCIIAENFSHNGGAGIYCSNGSPSIINCRICRNHTPQYGAGLHFENSNPSITNCVVDSNSTGYDGAGLHAGQGSNPVITNCTFYNNLSTDDGDAIFVLQATVTNCIFWCDDSIFYGEEGLIMAFSTIDINHSRVKGWTGDMGGVGNSGDAPLFFDSDGPDNNPYTWQDNDFRLNSGSSCIDAGDNSALPNDAFDIDGDGDTTEPIPTDLDGRPRVIDHPQTNPTGVPTPPYLNSIVDIGAYEVNNQQPHITVNRQSFTFLATSSMQNPTQQTLTIRDSGSGFLAWNIVEQPSWLTLSHATGTVGNDTKSITLTADIANLSPGTHTAHLKIIEAQADNAPLIIPVVAHVGIPRHVPGDYSTIQSAIDAAERADTIILADGTYTGTENKDLDFHGKPITLRSDSGDPTTCIIDCQDNGRAVCFYRNEGPDSVINGLALINGHHNFNSTFGPYGGAIFCYLGSPTITNCILANNYANFVGGALACNRASGPVLTNCILANNLSRNNGGAIYSQYAHPVLTNCTITNNSAGQGSAIYCYGRSALKPTIYNSIVRNNTPTEVGAQSSISVSYSNIRGGWDGPGNIDADPLFVAPDGPDGDPSTWQDNDYRLSPGSACIDAGSNGVLPFDSLDLDGNGITDELLPIDIAGITRLFDDPGTIDTGSPFLPLYPNVVDIGAHEFNGISIPGDLTGDGTVDEADFAILLAAFGHSSQETQYNYYCDYDHDGFITFADYQTWLQHYRDFVGNQAAPAPVGRPGDFDADNDVDLRDFAVMQTCAPATPANKFPCTLKFDLNDDGHVDAQDVTEFRTILLGP